MTHRYPLLLLTLCAFTAPLTAPPAPTSAPTDAFRHFWNIAEAVHKIEERSFRRINVGSLIEEALKTMLNKVDAHSSFFTPKNYQETIDFAAGQFAGVGICMIGKAVDDDSLLVVDVTHAGPADQVGIQSGDKIVSVDGKKLRGMTSQEVLSKLKGERGSDVVVKIIREKKPHSFTVTRDVIKDRNVLSYYFPQHKTLYIGLKTFSEKAPAQLRTLLEKAYERGSNSIIIDLRKNPGGEFHSAIKTAGLFLPEGTTVTTTRNNKHEEVSSYHTSGTPIHKRSTPLFLLVDNFTASCSEILAGALQYHARTHDTLHAFIVGTSTFGKASVQEVMPLSNGCALKLTNMLYYFPDGSCLQAKGLTPDMVVKPKAVPHSALQWVEDVYGKETSLSNHITRTEATGEPAEAVAEKKQKKSKKDLSPAEIEEEYQQSLGHDHQIHTCLTLSNTYAFARRYAPEQVATYDRALALLQGNVVVDGEVTVEEV